MIKNLSVLAKSVFAVTGKLAATPDSPDPSPKNDPLNDPVRFEDAPVNCNEVVPVIAVPLSVKDELVNAVPDHLLILLVLKVEAPLTATVAVVAPS